MISRDCDNKKLIHGIFFLNICSNYVDNSIFVRKNEDNNYLLAGGFLKYTQTFNRNLSESSKDLKLKNIEDEIKHSSNFVKNRINTNTNYAFLNDTIHNSKKLNNSKRMFLTLTVFLLVSKKRPCVRFPC